MTQGQPPRPRPSRTAADGVGPGASGTPAAGANEAPRQPPGEKGGPKGPEPTRYGDWEKGGRCFDF
jgi:hypothetical protein